MASGSWMNHRHRNLSGIPVCDILGSGNLPNREAFLDSLQIVLEPVGYQNWLAVGGFNQILQGIQLAVMKFDIVAVFAINGAIGHLGEFIRQCCGVPGIDFFVTQRESTISAFMVS